MTDRNEKLVAMRPAIFSAQVSSKMTEAEQFQNKTLRPIIKLQNDLLVEVFRNYIVKRKNIFYDLSQDKKMLFIENAIQKDMKFRNGIKGMIIGQFTLEEYEIYKTDSSALNKRIMNIVKERLQNNLLLFEKELV